MSPASKDGLDAPVEGLGPWARIALIHRLIMPVNAKGVLIAIARRSSGPKQLCFASFNTLANDAGCSRAACVKEIRWLRQEGLIEELLEPPGKNGTRVPNHRIVLWAAVQTSRLRRSLANTHIGSEGA